MKERVNRELKYYCNDFVVLRRQLKKLGAKFVTEVDQIDYFYNLPNPKKRLKLRIENGKQKIVHYYDSRSAKEKAVHFSVLKSNNTKLKPFLDEVLGVKKVVKKHREIWKSGRAVFHLDEVVGVGKIFELEIEGGKAGDADKFRQIFAPLLGAEIVGSNRI